MLIIGDGRHEVSAYETAPDYTVKGIIKGIPLEEDARSIHTNIVHARNPHALAAKRLSNTPLTQAPTTSAPPRCKLCGGTHMTVDRNCCARYKTPYIVTKRQWERRRAAEEAGAAATTDPAGKSRSRSRTPQSKPLPISEPHTGASEATTTRGSQLHTWRDPNEGRQGH
ncbi:hypothetical protein MTO96_051915 [Rhipicephalus appendiculatus]